MTSIENTNVPIYEIRFPAITICNNNQVYLPNTKNLTAKLKPHLHQKNSTNNPIYYVSGAGHKYSLVIVINVEPNMYVSGLAPFYGSEILIHDGFAYPEVSINPIIAAVNTSVTAQIGAHTIKTDKNVQSIPINKRGCSFDGEVKLDYESEYSYETCVTECRMDRIIELCHCIPYFYRYSGETRFCIYTDVPCLNRYKVLFYSTYNPKKGMHSRVIDEADDIGIDLEKCGCYPSCEDITYEVQTQTFNVIQNTSFFMPIQVGNKTPEISNKTFLFVNYQHLTLIQYRRDVRVTWNNLLGNSVKKIIIV
ncbi:sodium channel protein Nach-like [Chrysoperla carnea]|uniref:sodium channel protein Nach-like n=1 Tax=Chrysoperla carnea TaxID=189513 RepID=UPI001D07F604|nr:sodium channel protein Nach-like [Chrysoperla carnea]